MSGLFYTVSEYLIWIALALLMILVLFSCLAIFLGISTGVNALASKWRLTVNKKASKAPKPAEVGSFRSHLLRSPRFFHSKRTAEKVPFGKLHPPDSSSDSKRGAG